MTPCVLPAGPFVAARARTMKPPPWSMTPCVLPAGPFVAARARTMKPPREINKNEIKPGKIKKGKPHRGRQPAARVAKGATRVF